MNLRKNNKLIIKPVKIKLSQKYEVEERLKMFNSSSEGLHSAVRRLFLSSRLLGLLPLSGLMNPDSSQLKFTLKTPYAAVFFISIFGQLLMSLLNIYHLILNCCSLINITNMLFYTNGFIATMILIKLAIAWPNVVRKAESLERKLPPIARNLSRPCTLLTVFVLSTALIEHLLSISYGLKVAHTCNPNNFWETYFSQTMPWVFDYTMYAHWKGIISEIFNIQSTFLWSFNDLLIMACSVYLTEHFLVHKKLLKRDLKNDNVYMGYYRIQYLYIVRLVRIINKQIGIFVVTSFSCNLYWICWQLFNSLNNTNTGHFTACGIQHNQSGVEHTSYFAFSFSFLLMKTLLMSLLAAKIRSSSLKPLHLLFGISSSNYTIEVQRYIDQVKFAKVAISGLDFFHVTRRMILALFGTILTYELVLLQFNVQSYNSLSYKNMYYHNRSST